MDRRSSTAPHAAGGTATLLVLVTVMGGAVGALSLRASHLAGLLPAARVEPWLELLAVTLGVLAAAWVALSALLALVCVVARAAGRSWTAGEHLVLRVAPQVVRRAARVGVGVSVGAGLVLGAGTAQAAEPPASDGPPVVAVDLGWRPTAPGAGVDGTADPASSTVGDDVAHLEPAPAPAAPATAAGGDVAVRGDAAAGGSAAAGGVPASSAPGTGDVVAAADSSHASTAAPAAPGTTTDRGDAPSTPGAPSEAPEQASDAVPAPRTPSAPAPAGVAQRDAAFSVTRELPAEPSDEVVVLRGDTLWSIAARHLPPGAADAEVAVAVQRWFAANADVIGDDPDLILPGQVLTAPVA